MAKKDMEKKNRLDSMFRRELYGMLDRWASKYDQYGYQKQAKTIRIFKKHARALMGDV